MKKVYEDEIQVAYEDAQGARITTLKNRPDLDFWGNPCNQPERSKREDYECDFCQGACKCMLRQKTIDAVL